MSRESSVTRSAIAQIFVLGAIWGGAFTLMKVLVEELSPAEIAAGRLALGALAIVAVLGWRGTLRWPARDLLLPIAAVAMLDTVGPYLLVGWAETRIDSGAAAVLISAMPLFTVVFAAATMRDERIGTSRLAGMAAGFAGVVVLVGSPSALGHSSASGQAAVIAAAASYAAGGLYARRLLRRIEPTAFTAAKLTIGAGLAWAATIATGGGGGVLTMDAGGAAALATLGVVCTGVSFVLYFRIVAEAGSVAASTVTYVIPGFALLFGAVLLGESIEPHTVAGLALIVLGVAAVMSASWFERVAVRVRPSLGGQA